DQPLLNAAIDEIVRLAERREQSYPPALDHAVEVAGPWLGDEIERCRQSRLFSGRRGVLRTDLIGQRTAAQRDDEQRGETAAPPRRHRSTTSCQVTVTVSKAEPRRVVAPVLYTNFSDCCRVTGTDSVPPTRLLRCRSELSVPSTRDCPPANPVASNAS